MPRTFKLLKREIQFDSDKIIISDDARKQRILLLLLSTAGAVYGILSILKYFGNGEQFLLWSGVFLSISNLIILILLFARSTQKEIFLEEIKSIKTGQRSGNKYLDIRLQNNRLRRVIRVADLNELDNYIKEHFQLATS